MPTLYRRMWLLSNVREVKMTDEELKLIDEYKKIYNVETDLELLNRLLEERVKYLECELEKKPSM